jgi:hypothetical protein
VAVAALVEYLVILEGVEVEVLEDLEQVQDYLLLLVIITQSRLEQQAPMELVLV